jgi:hypothetical protein
MPINFIPGYNVKPARIDSFGVVTFTDGTNIITPNQEQCQAYGYKYDTATGTCTAFIFNHGVTTSSDNSTNVIKGVQNGVDQGVSNTYIMGDKNVVKTISRNNIVVGSYNKTLTGVNNAAVFGSYGIAQRPGEVVMGGGKSLGKSQSSTIHLSGTTENEAPTNLLVNGLNGLTTIARDSDTSSTSFTGFEANVMGVRTGGTAAGNVYDRILLRATGIAYLKADNQSVSTLGSFGTVTGWTAAVAFSGTNDMHIEVTGSRFMEIEWSCTLNLYEMKV